MRRYVQTFFRHPILLMLPMVVALAFGLFYISRQPRKYLASATVWCDVPVPNESTIFTGSTVMPSAGQAAVLTELLQTHSFLAKVAATGPWGGYVSSHDQASGDGLLSSLGRSVSVGTPGPHLLSITATRPAQGEALALVKVTTDTYIKEMDDTQHRRAVSSAGFFQLEVDSAQKALTTAQDQMAAYLAANQSTGGGPLGAAVDAKVTQLAQAVTSAQNSVNQARASQQNATLGMTSLADAGVIRLYDAPRANATPLSRRKVIVFVSLGSLLVGAMVSLFALLYLVVSDTSVRGAADIEEALGLEVVGRIDQFNTRRRSRTGVS